MKDKFNLSPREFENAVSDIVLRAGGNLLEFRVVQGERINSQDGTYQIDITARFEALGVEFFVLIECKHHKSAIKRQDVQVLRDKLLTLGAQKAILFSSSTFQKGALQYAYAHGIALVQVFPGVTGHKVVSGWLGRQDIAPIPGWCGRLIAGDFDQSKSNKDISCEDLIRFGWRIPLAALESKAGIEDKLT